MVMLNHSTITRVEVLLTIEHVAEQAEPIASTEVGWAKQSKRLKVAKRGKVSFVGGRCWSVCARKAETVLRLGSGFNPALCQPSDELNHGEASGSMSQRFWALAITFPDCKRGPVNTRKA